ncbi:hypothetical protein Y032_0707g1704 [Ancylostoma ceylanicum]|uniref:Uncharacterized protein n=1 Tax=Ancylostoma ceylanicum TaxID=53326 RepID=A0A016WH62_9BILA|nr:hypothetical protein Y032_0707g1704 [Ancylostoma ceylanicum]
MRTQYEFHVNILHFKSFRSEGMGSLIPMGSSCVQTMSCMGKHVDLCQVKGIFWYVNIVAMGNLREASGTLTGQHMEYGT